MISDWSSSSPFSFPLTLCRVLKVIKTLACMCVYVYHSAASDSSMTHYPQRKSSFLAQVLTIDPSLPHVLLILSVSRRTVPGHMRSFLCHSHGPMYPLIFCPVTSVSCVKIYLAQLSSTLCELPCLSREELIVPSAWLLDVCPFSPLVAFLRYVIIVCFPLHFSHQTEGQEWCLILLCSLVRCLLPVRWIGPSCTVP